MFNCRTVFADKYSLGPLLSTQEIRSLVTYIGPPLGTFFRSALMNISRSAFGALCPLLVHCV
ncbi:hypothetical protein HanRHA438_Chr05g0216391 [Helianthus annuus]|uniref:Uncharacterized protein n=1 Tax=Helianthus annuus TaxID=4232 RepID=A0A9K3IYP6_HELAN|nr:hypothetical protein HanXRQr2_Chr05g0206731 [Helianthus annuus]KAJ0569721.1 hypothetical protein HanHA300_Chr05g0169691 [Helianthus annuus]KAJ0749706.1 hypothetical protein HanLR1_Chr05g0173211 [Helianthus annuus]KAJ0918309.1 hypothetical protein HanRHA438_Chr05g0216391 [Helianthus annuus]